ncbi:MAG TPA: hypothetical protein VN788_00195 [Verrucomicrobiae bacterium]|nr:hypothetical protein [Verrucomicrobiae bacterium]
MYLMPATSARGVRPRLRARGMSGLGLITRSILDNQAIPEFFPVRPFPIFPFPAPPQPVHILPVVAPVPPATAPSGSSLPTPSSGMCVVESSPATGGVSSIVPCGNAGAGGGQVISPVNPANPQTFAPAPANYSNLLASPVPASYPKTQPYFAADGGVWNWNPTSGVWVETQLPGSAAAALVSQGAAAPSVSVTSAAPVTESSYQSVIDWFNSESLISGVKNFWILGAGFLGYLLITRKRGR